MKPLTGELRAYLDGLVHLNSEAGAVLESFSQHMPPGPAGHDLAEAALLLHNLSLEMRNLFVRNPRSSDTELEQIIAVPQNGAAILDHLADHLRRHEPGHSGWRVVKILQLMAHAYRMLVPVIFRWYADHEGDGLHHFLDTSHRIEEHLTAMEAEMRPVAA